MAYRAYSASSSDFFKLVGEDIVLGNRSWREGGKLWFWTYIIERFGCQSVTGYVAAWRWLDQPPYMSSATHVHNGNGHISHFPTVVAHLARR